MTFAPKTPLAPVARARNVTAVLGPTNTGKTHLAIERLVGHDSGMIGLPLRLLAREVYTRVAEKVGVGLVALVTGEEKVVPPGARFIVATVEAMPRDIDVSFVAIDEVQLAADLDRGHVFTDRILNMRGRYETLLLGSGTARGLIEKLLPGVNVVTRPRLSQLLYAGSKKITRLPRRSAVVAFSAEEVYAIAELIRRQRGGAAVVMGSLSPRTRNAQVELFQSGDVEFLVATDAVGMGLNLDVEHVAFAQARKFDGYQYRNLVPAELGQIAGRAGRHLRDGTFGATGQVPPFDDDVVRAIESHDFEPLRTFQWRSAELDFRDIDRLRASLDRPPNTEGLTRALPGDDQRALDYALRDGDVAALATTRERVALLWDVCQVPDFRKISPAQHGDLIVALYGFLAAGGVIPEDWLARQLAFADRVDGDIDALSARIAQVRTWTYVANRQDWLSDFRHWQARTRDMEDRLSDALHEKLTQRFVDRRTSVLMKRLRENAMLEAEIKETGAVLVEGQHVGELHGFRFVPDQTGDGPDAKAVRAAAAKALASEIDKRAEKLGRAPNEDFVLSSDATIRWLGQPVARLVAGEEVLKPVVLLLADEQLSGPPRDAVQARLGQWVTAHIGTLLKPLTDLRDAADLEGLARGVAFRMVEALGTLDRQEVADDVKALDQTPRATMRKYGVRFGAHHIYLPALLKPAPASLVALLWALKHGSLDMPGLAELPQLSASGRTSIPVDPSFDKVLYRLVGFRVAGPRAVRLDILERLADIIRPLVAWKPTDGATPPVGAIAQGGGFTVTVAMTSLLGCAGEDFAAVLRGLGYRLERRTVKVAAPAPAADAAPAETAAAETAAPVTEQTATDAVSDASPDAPSDAPSDAPVADVAADETIAPAETETAAEAEVSAEAAAPAENSDGDADVAETAAADGPVTEDAPEGVSAESDVSEGETDAAVAAEAEAPANAEPEEQVIEIWRPGRFDRGRRDGRGEGRGEGRGGAGRGEGRGEGRGGDRRGGHRSGQGAGHGAASGGASQPSGDQASGAPTAVGEPRSRRDEQRKRGTDFGSDRSGGKPRFDRPRGEPKGDRPEARADNRPDSRPADKPVRRERPVDPTSPFAALAALKADLEAKARKK
ncbi:helicase-related protein [Methylobrevis albus]|uniref:Helicase n=1 Tax=Methylobrevis albus TaxID=2793297 RepID=A0A931I0Q1_9HYPH|nr:helicase-related protein [Methylobrevis albus]MBH0237289.1 helicase [Methylobrevis albus]